MTGKNWQDASFRRVKEATALFAVGIWLSSPAHAAPVFIHELFSKPLDPTEMAELALGVFILLIGLIALALWSVSAMRVAKLAQARRNEFIGSALNNLGQGVVIVDPDRRIVFCNDRYLELYGLTRAEIAGLKFGPELIELRRTRGMINMSVDEFRESARRDSGYVTDLQNGKSILVRHRALPDGGVVSTHDDCTEQTSLSRQLATTKNFLESVIDNIPVCVAAKAIDDGRYMLANRAFENFSMFSRSQIIGYRADEIFSPVSAAAVKDADRNALESPEGQSRQELHVLRGGQPRTLASRRVIARDHNGKPAFLIALFDDITDNKSLSRELASTKKFLELVIDNIPVSLTVQDPADGRYLLVNRAAEYILGQTREYALGLTPAQIFQSGEGSVILSHDLAAVARGGVVVDEQPLSTPDGLRMFVTRRATVLDDVGTPQYLIKTREDVTERRQTESRMAHMAYHDSLTGLPNRTAFLQALAQMIDACSSNGDSFAVLSSDLNGLTEVNDVYGHVIGDKLLAEVSRRIAVASSGGMVARLGSDDFGLIMDGAQPDGGRALAEKILGSLADDFVIDGKTLRVTVTTGISLFPRDGKDATALLSNAAAAQFRAKAKARGSIVVFEPQMDHLIRDRRALHQDLASAIRNGELTLHYQPQAKTALKLADAEITGFEALARWCHPTRGYVSPGDFIPLAEESGLIVEMGEWILRQTCREAASWPNPLQIAVNLSPAQFMHGDLVGLVHSILLETGLSSGRLELEITEGVLIKDFDRGLALLRRLKALGVRVSMDDFGSGYSSLTYLQAFPFDKIKIDRTFVMNLGRNPQSAAIIRAVIGLGRGLEVSIIAEGVETAEQLAFLAAENCDGIQGYYLGRPGPISQYNLVVGRRDVLSAVAGTARLAG